MNQLGRVTSWAAVALLAGAVFSRSAEATFIVNIDQTSTGVVATGMGTLNLTGLTPISTATSSAILNPGIAEVDLGATASADSYRTISGPSNFGSGGISDPTTSTGDFVGITGEVGILLVPHGYTGASLSDTAAWGGASFTNLGLTPGTYTWSWGGAAAADDTFVVNIGVPEPSTLAVLGIGLLGLGLLRRRKTS